MAKAFSVEAPELTDLIKDLRGVDKATKTGMKKGLKRFTDELAERGEKEGRSRGGIHAHAIREGGIRKTVTGIVLDVAKSPTVLGAEFGAKRWAQFPEWKGNELPERLETMSIGYMIHPALRRYIRPGEDDVGDDVFTAITKEIEAR